jgi:UPF0755 protein
LETSVRRWILIMLLLAAGLGGGAWRWLNLSLAPAGSAPVDLSIEPGTSARGVAQAVSDTGLQVDPTLLFWWFRLSGQARQIKAGSYELAPEATPRSLLRKLVRGEEALRSLTLVEGWNFRQVRQALATADNLKQEGAAMPDDALMTALGSPGTHPEGRFFPDTYTYAKGSSDLALLKRAQRAMDKRLLAAWGLRSPDSPLKTPEQALILASIVEKETGRASDRPMVASVFSNRLRIGMPLQTDPTVIYGLGERFDGNLRKRDLQTDTPYNTYTRGGLPPTPIAMPGKASLLAALQPAPSKALYFVARGDGSSQFSANLDEHNRAVNKFQRGQ